MKVELKNSHDINRQRAEWQRDAARAELDVKRDVDEIKARWKNVTDIGHWVYEGVQNISFYASGATMALGLIKSLFFRKKRK